jgi:hypothetical protein
MSLLRIIKRLPLILFDFMAPAGTALPFGIFMQQLFLGEGSILGFPCYLWTVLGALLLGSKLDTTGVKKDIDYCDGEALRRYGC